MHPTQGTVRGGDNYLHVEGHECIKADKLGLNDGLKGGKGQAERCWQAFLG